MSLHVLYLVQLPLTARDRHRYGMDLLLARGDRVTVLDLGPLMVPDIPVARDHYRDMDDLTIMVANRWSALKEQILPLAGKVQMAVCTIAGSHLSARAWPVLRLLRRAGIPYLLLQNGAIPIAPPGATAARLVWRRWLDQLGRVRVLNSLIGRLPVSVLGIDPAALVVRGGRRSVQGGQMVGPETEFIDGHSNDYDHLLETRAQPALPSRPVAVFLDQFLPFHPDVIQDKAKPIAPEPYYRGLCALFARIEANLGLEVEIAAHPRSDYHRRGEDWFQGRRLVYGDTAALVRSSSLVIAHYSTSISFAVAFAKPVLLVSSPAILGSLPIRERMTRGYAAALAQPVLDLDAAGSELDQALTVDRAVYDRFVDDYLRAPGSPDLPLWEIIAKRLDAKAP